MLIASDVARDGAIVDAQGRAFRKLRVSLTAACNYACSYCVPDGKQLHRARHELDLAGFLRLIDLLIDEAGIEQIRLTGGEPLIAAQFDAILPELAKRPIADVSLTTNGQFLQQKLPLMVASGIKRINVSLDSLDPARFRQICKSGEVETVTRGIEAALDAGIHVKVNMVPLKGINDVDVLPLLNWCLARGVELRFIELMRMGHWQGNGEFEQRFYGEAEILAQISGQFVIAAAETAIDATARRFRVESAKYAGYIGVIANESAPFCASCSRLRLSSAGFLHGCLSNSRRHALHPLLALDDEQARAQLRRLLWQALGDKQDAAFGGSDTVMKAIGG